MTEARSFSYKVLDAAGKEHRGNVEAVSEQSAVQQLQARGLLVLQVETGHRSAFTARTKKLLSGAVLVTFTQQLATLLGAGQPLERALNTLGNQANEKRRGLVNRIREQVKEGKPLSEALREEGQFSPLYVSLIRAGEAGGALETAMEQLAAYLERSHKLRAEVINALIYPAFLVFGVVGALALLLAYVVPQFVPIFADLGVPIPWITQAILGLSELLSSYGLIMLIAVGFAVWMLVAGQRTDARRVRQDRWLLRLRVIGPLSQKLEAARFARTLGTLLENGVPLLQGLIIVRQATSNVAIRALLEQATEHVKGGGTLTEGISDQRLLPELAVQMIEVGEQSGKLSSMLIKVADTFDVEAKRGIDRILAALVPTLTVVMAGMVALIMLAIMLPLMSLTSNI